MDSEEFWSIVDAACTDVERAADLDERWSAVVEACTDRLTQLPPDAIVGFALRQWELRNRANRWDLWAAAYAIEGGCSDDAFNDFRQGLISWGRNWYEQALADPDSLVDHPAAQVRDDALIGNEDFNYVAVTAYTRATGDKDAYYAALESAADIEGLRAESEPEGEGWDFDDAEEVARHLPRLAAAFLN